jgi:RimJ/RimL family protein N-acetyltransferase
MRVSLPIETDRLLLRAFRRGDVDAVFAYRQLEDVARFLYDPPMTRESCAEIVQARITQLAFAQDGDRMVLAVERKADPGVIGEISLTLRDFEAGQGEAGYILSPYFQRRGYATEAVRVLLRIGFRDLDLHRIYARCDSRNVASWRLMERLGMRREAHFREHKLIKGSLDEEYVYAVLAREWAERAVDAGVMPQSLAD